MACMPVCVWTLCVWSVGAAYDVACHAGAGRARVAAVGSLRLLRGPFWTGWGRRAGWAMNAAPGMLSAARASSRCLEQRRWLLLMWPAWGFGATGSFWVGDGEASRVGGLGVAPAHALGKFPPPRVLVVFFGLAYGWRGVGPNVTTLGCLMLLGCLSVRCVVPCCFRKANSSVQLLALKAKH